MIIMKLIPKHIGVILDGNRRFAKALLKKPWEGHKIGLIKARQVLKWACELGIKYMTTYTLSIENLKTRPKKELKMILKYIDREMDNVLTNAEHVVNIFSVKVRFIGRMQLLPKTLQKKFKQVEEKTKNNKKHILNIAVAYGGQQEIVDATKKILEEGLKGVIKPSDLNEQVIRSHLWTNGQPEPDLIMRPGGESRLSNFLPFQSVYSELFFLKKRWPEISKKDFLNVINDFNKRQRRFGS